jgi:hypothetical protein
MGVSLGVPSKSELKAMRIIFAPYIEQHEKDESWTMNLKVLEIDDLSLVLVYGVVRISSCH